MRKLLFMTVALAWALTVQAGVDFSLRDVASGKTLQLSDFRGQWVVVNYWATWCPPCLEEIPDLVEFHEEHKGKAVVVGINMEELEPGKLGRFVDEHFITYPIGPQTSSEQMVGPVPGLPTTYLISPEGRLVARQVGPISRKDLEGFISSQDGSALQ